jgi:hypothetical protein
MVVILAFLAGAALGWTRAGRRGGDRLDRLQYAAAHAIFFALVAFILVVLAQRAGLI